MQWSRDNQGKPPNEQVANLKQAKKEAQMLLDYLDEIKAEEREKRKEEISSIPWNILEAIDQETADFNEEQDQWFNELVEGDADEDVKSQMAFAFMKNWKVDWDTAMLIVEDEWLDKKDPNRMKPMDKLRLIESGRKKAAEHEVEERNKKFEIAERKAAEMKKYDEYRDSLPKTWTSYVDGIRLEKNMLGRPDPFPDLPNPLKRGTPMPDDWPPENVSPDHGDEYKFHDFEERRTRIERDRMELMERYERERKQRENLMEDIHPGDKFTKNKLDELFDGQS